MQLERLDDGLLRSSRLISLNGDEKVLVSYSQQRQKLMMEVANNK